MLYAGAHLPLGRVPSESLICPCCFSYLVESYTEAPRIVRRSRRSTKQQTSCHVAARGGRAVPDARGFPFCFCSHEHTFS